MMNILLTSVGRRTYIVEYFKNAVSRFGGKVHALNSDENSAACALADFYVRSPLVTDEEYEKFLLDYCLKNDIHCVISLFDIELPILSRFKKKFKEKGILIIVADEWITEMANDKWKTQMFLKEHNLKTTRTFLSLETLQESALEIFPQKPVFVKPRWGMGSISIFKAETFEEAKFYYSQVLKGIKNSYLKYESEKDLENSVIIQEMMFGDEYGLDIINDLEGNYQTTIIKKKLAMRAGETDIAVTVSEPALESLGKKLALITKHPGNMDVDVFFDGKDAFILEINPRFGGGYPFSHIAGVNLPNAIVSWYMNESVDITEKLTAKIGVKSMKGILMVSANGK